MLRTVLWDKIKEWSEVKAEVVREATADPHNTERRDEIATEVGARWEGGFDAVMGIYAEIGARLEAAKRPAPSLAYAALWQRPIAGPPKPTQIAVEEGPPKIEVALQASGDAGPKAGSGDLLQEVIERRRREATLAKYYATEQQLRGQQKAAEPKKGEEPKTGNDLTISSRALGFQHSKSPAGIPASLENAITAINVLDIDCRYDVFHDKIIVKGHECGINGDALENLENVTLKVRQAVLMRFSFDPSTTFTFDALKLRCLDRVFDPVRDYLDGLRWDGEARLDDWLVQYCGAEDTELNRAIGRKMLIAAVRRVRSPGCKFDYIVVLEGAQGVGKSSLLRLLAGEENFSDNEIIGLDKREQQESIQGVWIYEVAELDGLHKSDVTKVKLFASKTVDSARPAYARSRVDRPRRGIFVATTNEDTYLRDTTGNRRFWPVRVGKIDLDWVKADRDQLWAEACELEASGEPLVIPEALWPDAAQQQQSRLELDPWEDALAQRLARLKGGLDGKCYRASDIDGNSEWRIASDYLLTDILDLPKDRQTNNHTKRLASIMRVLGWHRHNTPIRIGKTICRGYTKRIEEE